MTFNFKKISKKVWIPVASFLAVLLIGGIALAATTLNKTYQMHLIITTTPQPTEIDVYTDVSYQTPLTVIDFGSISGNGGYLTKSVYVKPDEMDASAVIVTYNSLPPNYIVNKLGSNDVTGEIQLQLTVPSGQAPIEYIGGSINLSGSH